MSESLSKVPDSSYSDTIRLLCLPYNFAKVLFFCGRNERFLFFNLKNSNKFGVFSDLCYLCTVKLKDDDYEDTIRKFVDVQVGAATRQLLAVVYRFPGSGDTPLGAVSQRGDDG